MTTHVFIVDERTFKVHLEYMFVGTGSGEKKVDFNNNKESELHFTQENGLVSMMSDFSRVRIDDYVIFYVQASNGKEGKFFGVYQISSKPFYEDGSEEETNKQYLKCELAKNLTFRALIKPYKVYAYGVTEWEALDEIKNINSPSQMLWSLIYRKLKGNRGNTMITIYESERLFNLISIKNNNNVIPQQGSYTYKDGKVEASLEQQKSYNGNISEYFNILPRLKHKKDKGQAYESHLQMYIMQNIDSNKSLNDALSINNNKIEWIGNEVSCGVGMQRIDVMLSVYVDDTERHIVPIELKAVPVSSNNTYQISRYVDWIEQYYVPNRPSTIRPVLICPKTGYELTEEIIRSFEEFNDKLTGRCLPLEYIEFEVKEDKLSFENIKYIK